MLQRKIILGGEPRKLSFEDVSRTFRGRVGQGYPEWPVACFAETCLFLLIPAKSRKTTPFSKMKTVSGLFVLFQNTH